MAKLYFRYGTVGSAKTLNLLAVAHNYRQQGKKALLLKPQMDSRFGIWQVRSRAGLSEKADFVLGEQSEFRLNGMFLGRKTPYEKDIIDLDCCSEVSCILVDEAQFLPARIIDQLHQVAIAGDIPVLCYGLKTNFRSELFAGAQRLLELADSIDEIKSTCYFCNRKALFNLKFQNGSPTCEGPEVELGAEEVYKPACKYCYHSLLSQN